MPWNRNATSRTKRVLTEYLSYYVLRHVIQLIYCTLIVRVSLHPYQCIIFIQLSTIDLVTTILYITNDNLLCFMLVLSCALKLNQNLNVKRGFRRVKGVTIIVFRTIMFWLVSMAILFVGFIQFK